MSTSIVFQETKLCTVCGETKSTGDYYKNSRTKDGLYHCCKKCHNKRTGDWSKRNRDRNAANARARRSKDPESARAYSRSYYAMAYSKDEAYLAAARERSAKWREANKATAFDRWKAFRDRHKEKLSAKDRAYYVKHRALIQARTRAYQDANPDKKRLHSRVTANRRRKAVLASDVHYGVNDVERLKKLQRNKCANCGKSLKNGFHVDHRIPLAKGGDNGPMNIELLCPTCNISKGAKLPHEFAQLHGRLL